jgi:hypothetical protein
MGEGREHDVEGEDTQQRHGHQQRDGGSTFFAEGCIVSFIHQETRRG